MLHIGILGFSLLFHSLLYMFLTAYEKAVLKTGEGGRLSYFFGVIQFSYKLRLPLSDTVCLKFRILKAVISQIRIVSGKCICSTCDCSIANRKSMITDNSVRAPPESQLLT